MILNKNNKILFINQINNFNTHIDNINKTDINTAAEASLSNPNLRYRAHKR